MTTFKNNYDELEKIIYQEGLKIKAIHFHPELDMMIIVLNNKRILQRSLAYTERLKNASPAELDNYRLIADGVGIHWPDLDEDISLKSLLKEEVTQSIHTLTQSLAS